MAEPKAAQQHVVQFEYRFDRLPTDKLAQVYQLLVPDQRRPIGQSHPRRNSVNKLAAIYPRVSSDRQKDNHTIASQTVALKQYSQTNGYAVPAEWVFEDEGYSGANLARPGLEAHAGLGDRRADRGAVPPGKAAQGPAGSDERTVGSALRVSICEEERPLGGLLCH